MTAVSSRAPAESQERRRWPAGTTSTTPSAMLSIIVAPRQAAGRAALAQWGFRPAAGQARSRAVARRPRAVQVGLGWGSPGPAAHRAPSRRPLLQPEELTGSSRRADASFHASGRAARGRRRSRYPVSTPGLPVETHPRRDRVARGRFDQRRHQPVQGVQGGVGSEHDVIPGASDLVGITDDTPATGVVARDRRELVELLGGIADLLD